MENKNRVVQIRKKGGLNKIIKDKNSGSTLRPMLFRSESKNWDEDGTLEGEYRGNTILDTKHFIAPHWNDLKNSWAFSGNTETLSRLISKMKLRYPKNHPQEGDLITSNTKEDASRLTNRSDDVFCHPDLYGKFFMENGRLSLNMADPKQEFLYLCYKGNTDVEDKSSDQLVSKYISAGTKYELVSPKQETKAKKKNADKDVRAIVALSAMDGDDIKMRAIAEIMELPQYSPTTDASGLFVLLKEMAAENRKVSAKYGKTYQDRFLELTAMDSQDLFLTHKVWTAKSRGILRKRDKYTLFNGERLEGITTISQLASYFLKNQEEFIKLEDLLSENGSVN